MTPSLSHTGQGVFQRAVKAREAELIQPLRDLFDEYLKPKLFDLLTPDQREALRRQETREALLKAQKDANKDVQSRTGDKNGG